MHGWRTRAKDGVGTAVDAVDGDGDGRRVKILERIRPGVRRKNAAAEKRRDGGEMTRRESVTEGARAGSCRDGGEGGMAFLKCPGEKLSTQELQVVVDRK